jgi:ribosome-binding protein aMBF1 (putative translation factor)
MGEPNPAERARRRLTPATMTPEQRSAYDRRKAERATPEYQEGLRRDIEAIRREFPPLAPDPELLSALDALRAERERQGLSLEDVTERSRIHLATLRGLEAGAIPNPSYQTVRDYAKALGKKIAWTLAEV